MTGRRSFLRTLVAAPIAAMAPWQRGLSIRFIRTWPAGDPHGLAFHKDAFRMVMPPPDWLDYGLVPVTITDRADYGIPWQQDEYVRLEEGDTVTIPSGPHAGTYRLGKPVSSEGA